MDENGGAVVLTIGDATSYTYTADNFTNDLLTSKTDAKGQVTKYSYDSYYLVTNIQRYPNGLVLNGVTQVEDPCQHVAYNYDSYTDPATNKVFGAWGQVAMVATGSPGVCAVPGFTAQLFEQMFTYNSTGRVITKRLEMLQPNTSAQVWDVSYTYNQLGQQVSITYPGIKYTTGYNSVDNPMTLTDSTRNLTVVQNATYNAANQPLQTTFQPPYAQSFTETRTYNQLNELIGITNFGGTVNLAYNFTGGQNNGQIASSIDSGTETYYTYDGLKRLYSATSGAWSQTYNYDGFGNMYSESGSGATFTGTFVNPVTNQNLNQLLGGNYCYDANGNMISDQNGGGCTNPNYAYDVANRLVRAKVGSGTEYYGYGADNKRIARFSAVGLESIYIYGANGEKLVAAGANNVYFAGRLIKQGTDTVYAYADNDFVAVDRMGSVKAALATDNEGPSFNTSYLPYGEELNATASDIIKFATYTRDESTGLDSADQRFYTIYTSQFGRFMSADRFKQAAKANNSGSWNKYSYTRGDPVTRGDRKGTCDTDLTSLDFDSGSGGETGCDDNSGGGPDDTICAAVGLLEGPNGNCITPATTGVSNTEIIDPCPLSGIVGQFTNDPNSPTPVHDLFTADVATLIDHIFEQLNAEGIVPEIEDGFRTTGEQADRKKKYPIAANLSWHEVGRAIDINRHDPNFAAIESAFTAAGFRDGKSFNDLGHFDFAGGTTLTQAQADTCTKEHPNGN